MMKLLRKITKSKDFWPILIVLIVATLASRTLLFQKGYFNMHDDLQMMRQLQMEKCFLDGQIPCRWVPDMGYGFGFPLFNFYPPLPYLIGQGIRFLGFSFVNTAKLLFALAIFVSGITMYFFSKEFFKRLGGVFSSIFYLWAPYHAVDVYVRGAMNETWALAWFPLIFWAGYRLIQENKNKKKWIILLALAWFALLTSHNLMVLIFGPFFLVWIGFWYWRKRKMTSLKELMMAGILAFLLASFFTIPAVFENGYTQIRGQLVGYYDYTAHFVDLRQLLISRFWGYGPSVWDVIDDGMSFQIGHLHWIFSLILFVWALKKLRRQKAKKSKDLFYLFLFFFLTGWLAAFLTHSRSTFVWQAFPFLGLLQFSWRFLTIIIFSFSFLSGFFVFVFEKIKFKKWILAFLSAFLIFFNWHYFLPELGHMGPLTDEEKFSDAAWDLQQTAGIYDYLPVWAETAPKEPRSKLVEVLKGDASFSSEKEGTNWATFDFKAENEASLRLGIFKFPGWKIYVNGKEVPTYVPEEEKWGRMWFDLKEKEGSVMVSFENTWPRSFGNSLSLISWTLLLTLPLWQKQYKNSVKGLKNGKIKAWLTPTSQKNT